MPTQNPVSIETSRGVFYTETVFEKCNVGRKSKKLEVAGFAMLSEAELIKLIKEESAIAQKCPRVAISADGTEAVKVDKYGEVVSRWPLFSDLNTCCYIYKKKEPA